jgi:hypothetical protein
MNLFTKDQFRDQLLLSVVQIENICALRLINEDVFALNSASIINTPC